MINKVIINGSTINIESSIKTKLIAVDVFLEELGEIEDLNGVTIELMVTMQENSETFQYSGEIGIVDVLERINNGQCFNAIGNYELIMIDPINDTVFAGNVDSVGDDDSTASLCYDCHDQIMELKKDINFLYNYIKFVTSADD